jgi:isopentenyl diphosphate isomerase/L-lactate dehydrogenase-like FMN-dependent dehydrogenase
LGGAAGLTRVLEILDEEIGTTMANIGAATITDLTPDHVRWSIPAPPT